MGKGVLPRCINSSVRNVPVATHVEPDDGRKGLTKIIESKSRPVQTPQPSHAVAESAVQRLGAHSRRSPLGARAPAGSGASSRAAAGARRRSAQRRGLHQ